jgi:predicted amidohydrolase YtcJ
VFTAVGTKEEMHAKYPDTEIRQLDSNTVVLPGLYDSHGHIMFYGAMLESVNLFGTRSVEGRTLSVRTNGRGTSADPILDDG